jgi:hypothetical protein
MIYWRMLVAGRQYTSPPRVPSLPCVIFDSLVTNPISHIGPGPYPGFELVGSVHFSFSTGIFF